MLDDHGQPLNRLYSAKRLNDRAIDELIGISRALVADENVNQQEAEFLYSWLNSNFPFCNDRIVNQLYFRIKEMLSYGIVDPDEQGELLQILAEFSGESTIVHGQAISSSLPLCSPPPIIQFAEKMFCFTGKFSYGPRKICQEVIIERGGFAVGPVSQKVDYLVVGTFCSTDWLHPSYGLKIKKAAEQREQGIKTSIVSEDHWARYTFAE